MPFSNLSLGFKLVARNKRRFVVVNSGLILAISIIGALFLVASAQAREMGLEYLQGYERPIGIHYMGTTMNMTDYNDMENLILEADALGTNIVDDVIHGLLAESLNGTGDPAYCFSRNESIDWPALWLNSSMFTNLLMSISDDFNRQSLTESGWALNGSLPAKPKEIMLTKNIATAFNISINDTLTIGNYQTEQNVSGYKVTGIVLGSGSIDMIFIRYPDFQVLHEAIGDSEMIRRIDLGYPVLEVQIDISSASIFTVNEIVEDVNLLANRIKSGITYKGLTYDLYNSMEFLSGISVMLTMFLLVYIALLVVMLLPAITLAGYVSKTIGFEMFEKRAAEFSQFRSRGFSRAQMIKVLSSEVLVSSLFCSGIAGLAGIGMSYLFEPIAATFTFSGNTSTSQDVFNPFTFTETGPIYIVMMVVLSLLFVLGTYTQPMQLSFQRELIDSLKEKVRQSKQEKRLVGGIVGMFLLGGIPLVLYLLLAVIPPATPFALILSSFSPVICALTIAAPFFLALGMIKLLGERRPAALGKFCSAFISKKHLPLKHVVTRSVASKSAKVSKLAMIVLFTIAFGFCVRITLDSLAHFRQEKAHITLGGDVWSSENDLISNLNSTRSRISTMENVTAASFSVSTYGTVVNQSSNQFMYQSFIFNFLDLTDHIDSLVMMDDKYLYDTTWNQLASKASLLGDVVVLPSSLQSVVNGTTLTLYIEYNFYKTYTIAGYYKVFPGIVSDAATMYNYNIIVNDDPIALLAGAYFPYDMVMCVKTSLPNQTAIDEFAAGMNLTNAYYTMTNVASKGGGFNMISLVDMPIFFGLLEIDSWFAIAISLVGIGTLTFMRITSERKEIGLFRIRGFDRKMMLTMQISEKFVPILVGGLVGIAAGVLSGWFAATTIALNFIPFNSVIHFPIALIVDGENIIINAIVPIVLFFGVILVAIWNELRQNLSSIMDEED